MDESEAQQVDVANTSQGSSGTSVIVQNVNLSQDDGKLCFTTFFLSMPYYLCYVLPDLQLVSAYNGIISFAYCKLTSNT